MWNTIKDQISSYRNRWGRRIPSQWYRSDLQKDQRRKLSESKERHIHTDTKSTHQRDKKRKENLQDISSLKQQRKIIESCKRINTSHM